MAKSDRLPLRIAALISGLPPVPDSTLLILESPRDPGFVLPVLIGNGEGKAIRDAHEGMPQQFSDRPTPYDLLVNLLEVGQLEVQEVFVDKIKKGTYHAKLVIAAEERTVVLDCRTSDGVALALRTHAPIFVEHAVFEESKRPREEFQAVMIDEPEKSGAEDEERAFKEALEGMSQLDLDELEEA
ncbi:bifunctional nuclease family protein [bacterium]|nr:bifunctional nuclease family protein [bacterium]